MLTIYHCVNRQIPKKYEFDLRPEYLMVALNLLERRPGASETAIVFDSSSSPDEAGCLRGASFFRCQRGCWHGSFDDPTETAVAVAA